MPVMNGYEATRIIKQKYPGLPVIAQTAAAMAGERKKALKAGCDAYISKPINLKMLKTKMFALMNQPKDKVGQNSKQDNLLLQQIAREN